MNSEQFGKTYLRYEANIAKVREQVNAVMKQYPLFAW